MPNLRKIIAMLASAFFSLAVSGQIAAAEEQSAVVLQAENAEMSALFAADQAIRQEVEKRGGWLAVKDDKSFMQLWKQGDANRLTRTRELLEDNALGAGIDFYRAAFIFQHGDNPEDYLKAHHLAVVAISKGYDARWISAATLDRYLLAIGKQQIYGTQYFTNETGDTALQPVQPGVVSDAERALLNVPTPTETM